jgi:hypothetical protein
VGSEIDNHIKDRTAHAPRDLRFLVQRPLEMQAAHRAATPAEGQALLGDFGIETLLRELLPAPGTREEAAFVFPRLDVDQPRARKPRRGQDHAGSLPCARCGR